jgi:hypothetical protein
MNAPYRALLTGACAAMVFAWDASAQEQIPACGQRPHSLLEWDVLRGFEHPRTRSVDLDFTGRTHGAAVKPVYVRVARRDPPGARTLAWRGSLNQHYFKFRPRRRETVHFLAIYAEDRSSTSAPFNPREFVAIPIPPEFQGPPFNLPPTLTVPLPATSGPTVFRRDVCARFLELHVRRGRR